MNDERFCQQLIIRYASSEHADRKSHPPEALPTMPLYEFVCKQCDHEQELLVRGEPTPQCQSCGSSQLVKLLSVPAAPSTLQGHDLPPQGSCGSGCGCFPGGG